MATLKVTDDLGRTLVFGESPRRVVSLVPSDTYSLIALGVTDRIVGRTRFCTMPEVAHVPEIGGTKDVDSDAVLALGPDLVIANQEENSRPGLEELAARSPVLVSFPRRVSAGLAHLARLTRILGLGADEPARTLIRRAYALRDRTTPTSNTETPAEGWRRVAPPRGPEIPSKRLRAFVPIWIDPLMTLNADTFGSDVLAQIGIDNVFGRRLRLYPLAADLGKTAAADPAGRDVRYPRITLAELQDTSPDLVILPDEPFAFGAGDEAMFRDALPRARIVRVSGRDLFWYGAWSIDALDRLALELAAG